MTLSLLTSQPIIEIGGKRWRLYFLLGVRAWAHPDYSRQWLEFGAVLNFRRRRGVFVEDATLCRLWKLRCRPRAICDATRRSEWRPS